MIGLSIQFEKWIWIWIDNQIIVMDLDWIDNPKKLDLTTAWLLFTVVSADFDNVHKDLMKWTMGSGV